MNSDKNFILHTNILCPGVAPTLYDRTLRLDKVLYKPASVGPVVITAGTLGSAVDLAVLDLASLAETLVGCSVVLAAFSDSIDCVAVVLVDGSFARYSVDVVGLITVLVLVKYSFVVDVEVLLSEFSVDVTFWFKPLLVVERVGIIFVLAETENL